MLSLGICLQQQKFPALGRLLSRQQLIKSGRNIASNRKSPVLYLKQARGYKTANKPKEKIGPVAVIFLVVPVTTFSLGVWQYNRRQWKIDKIAELDYKVRKSKPQSLPSGTEDLSELEYMRFKAEGKFINSEEIFIGPRTLINAQGGSSSLGVISSGEKVGFHVITPFQVQDGPKILVNRGWIPRSKMDVKKRLDSQVEDVVKITGALRLNEETSSLSPPNKVETNIWFSRDITALAERLNTEQIFLDLDAESGVHSAERGGPIAGQSRVSLRNDHVQYMLTWWGLTLATILLWMKRFVW